MDTPIGKTAELLDNDRFLEKVGVTMKSSLQGDRPPWQDFTICDLGPANGLLVTHINRTQDLLRVHMKKIQSKKVQTTEEWLRNCSLESSQLTSEHLINEGNIIYIECHFFSISHCVGHEDPESSEGPPSVRGPSAI